MLLWTANHFVYIGERKRKVREREKERVSIKKNFSGREIEKKLKVSHLIASTQTNKYLNKYITF